MKALIFDFNDSFTYNILNELTQLDVQCIVKSIRSFEDVKLDQYDLIVLGPGPGVIGEYSVYFDFIEGLIESSLKGEFKLLGICLGHQLIHKVLGRSLVQLSKPIHGQSKEITISNHEILIDKLKGKSLDVQFYNSWAIENSLEQTNFDEELVDENGFVLASFSANITTYQFHPESVGTSCPNSLFIQAIV